LGWAPITLTFGVAAGFAAGVASAAGTSTGWPGFFCNCCSRAANGRSAGGGAVRATTRRCVASRDGFALAAAAAPVTLWALGAIGAMRVICPPLAAALRSIWIAACRTGLAPTNTVLGTAVTAPAIARLAYVAWATLALPLE
jgi:hypothetical protein